jgi:hypothetical protein
VGDLGAGWSAIIGAAVGAAATGLAAWRVAKLTLDREDSRQITQHAHERDLADDALRQQRLASAYETILFAVLRATRILQMWQLGGTVPTFIEDEQMEHYFVQTNLFGSNTVSSQLKSWSSIGSEILRVITSLTTLENRPVKGTGWQSEWDEAYKALTPLQTRLSGEGDDIVKQMRTELGTK